MGAGAFPGSARYSRWVVQSAKKSVPRWTHHAPPPYSCTRVRTDVSSGLASTLVPPAS